MSSTPGRSQVSIVSGRGGEYRGRGGRGGRGAGRGGYGEHSSTPSTEIYTNALEALGNTVTSIVSVG